MSDIFTLQNVLWACLIILFCGWASAAAWMGLTKKVDRAIKSGEGGDVFGEAGTGMGVDIEQPLNTVLGAKKAPYASETIKEMFDGVWLGEDTATEALSLEALHEILELSDNTLVGVCCDMKTYEMLQQTSLPKHNLTKVAGWMMESNKLDILCCVQDEEMMMFYSQDRLRRWAIAHAMILEPMDTEWIYTFLRKLNYNRKDKKDDNEV
jgi:hypothetical protein